MIDEPKRRKSMTNQTSSISTYGVVAIALAGFDSTTGLPETIESIDRGYSSVGLCPPKGKRKRAPHRHMCWEKRPLGHKQFNERTVWIGKAYRPLHGYKGACWRVCTGLETVSFSDLTPEDQQDFLLCSPSATETTVVFVFHLQRTRLAIHLESFCPATLTAAQILQRLKAQE